MNDALPMIIPWQALAPETLSRLIDEFVTRDGTDYGAHEARLTTKIEQVQRALERGEAEIAFDPETESCNIRPRETATTLP